MFCVRFALAQVRSFFIHSWCIRVCLRTCVFLVLQVINWFCSYQLDGMGLHSYMYKLVNIVFLRRSFVSLCNRNGLIFITQQNRFNNDNVWENIKRKTGGIWLIRITLIDIILHVCNMFWIYRLHMHMFYIDGTLELNWYWHRQVLC